MFDDELNLNDVEDNLWEALDSDFQGSDFDDWADYDETDIKFDD
ncbi:hypothetical protein [Photobacterium frigidiphilum]|nr:hypothetical protein [Photobacterium frigidiphilum]